MVPTADRVHEIGHIKTSTEIFRDSVDWLDDWPMGKEREQERSVGEA